jgi:hypothetical protein
LFVSLSLSFSLGLSTPLTNLAYIFVLDGKGFWPTYISSVDRMCKRHDTNPKLRRIVGYAFQTNGNHCRRDISKHQ